MKNQKKLEKQIKPNRNVDQKKKGEPTYPGTGIDRHEGQGKAQKEPSHDKTQ